MWITIEASLVVNNLHEAEALRQCVEDVLTDNSSYKNTTYIPTWNLKVKMQEEQFPDEYGMNSDFGNSYLNHHERS